MRARYSAHAVGDHRYLLDTWHPDTRPPGVAGGAEHWLGLEVGDVVRGGALDADGTVSFAAHFRSGERTRVLRETSRFVRLGARWVYYDGDLEF
jgi:SEC-C motif domain protein